MSDQRAATEVLGFILAFAIITASIGIIYTAGFSGLQDARDDEQLKNVERAFDVLAANIEEVRRFGTPSRSTEIRLRDGRLLLAAQTNMTVKVGTSLNITTPMRPITYVSDDEDTLITFEGGAVFRASEGQSIMLSEPGWIATDERLIIPALGTYRQDGPNSLSTAGTALLVAQSTARIVNSTSGNDLKVEVTMNTTSARAGAWLRYFERIYPGGTVNDPSTADGSFTYVFEANLVRVVRAIIGLTLSP